MFNKLAATCGSALVPLYSLTALQFVYPTLSTTAIALDNGAGLSPRLGSPLLTP